MSYNIKFTNKNKPGIEIAEDAINNAATDITLFGRKRLEYGKDLNANLLHILENFACPETRLPDPTPSPTPTQLVCTPPPTGTPAATVTSTPSASAGTSPTPTPTVGVSTTAVPTPTPTRAPSSTPDATPTNTPEPGVTQTVTPTRAPSSTPASTPPATPPNTPPVTQTATPAVTPSPTPIAPLAPDPGGDTTFSGFCFADAIDNPADPGVSPCAPVADVVVSVQGGVGPYSFAYSDVNGYYTGADGRYALEVGLTNVSVTFNETVTVTDSLGTTIFIPVEITLTRANNL